MFGESPGGLSRLCLWLRHSAPTHFSHAGSTKATLYFTWDARGEVGVPDTVQDTASAPLRHWASLASSITADSSAVLIDLGNAYFPGFLSRFSYGSMMNEVLKTVGLRARAVGPGDFFLGSEYLIRLRDHAAFDFVCANIIDKKSGKHLFTREKRFTFFDFTIRIIPVIAPGQTWNGPDGRVQEEITIADPVKSIESVLKNGAGLSGQVTLCLCEKSVLEKYPAILDLQGIDVVVCAMTTSDVRQKKYTRESTLDNGKRILYVPPFQHGAGRLEFSHGDTMMQPTYSVKRFEGVVADTTVLDRLVRLRSTWWNLYRGEHRSTIAVMDSALKSNHAQCIGNILREWSGCELASFEKTLVSTADLPASIGLHDLDKLLTASPDLLIMRIRGASVSALQRSGDYSWIGMESSKVARRSLSSQELYTVVITESAFQLFKKQFVREMAGVSMRRLYITAFDAVSMQLAQRKRKNYDFAHLDRRWRLHADPSMEISMRRLTVGNADSVRSLAGVSYSPFSSWDLNVKAPFTVRNALNRFDVLARIEYAASGEKIGRNLLETKLDYSFGTSPVISPYSSAGYQTYVKNDDGIARPVRLRTTLGASSNPAGWRLKVGAGAERSVKSAQENPFAPLNQIFADSGRTNWSPGIELAADGSYSIDQFLRKIGVPLAPYQDLRFGIQGETYFNLQHAFPRVENKINMDLTASPALRIRLKFGVRTYYAYFFSQKSHFYNLEPSLSVLGTYPVKW